MNSLDSNNFQLIKRDFRELRENLFGENKINDWDKIVIIYIMSIFFNNLYVLYNLIDIVSKDNNSSFQNQFKNIYILFFITCSVRSSYGYFLNNVMKINPKLGHSIFNNTHKYFV
jgi:hypothetical protein